MVFHAFGKEFQLIYLERFSFLFLCLFLESFQVKLKKTTCLKLQSWTEVVVTPTPSSRIQCCHVKSQFNIDLEGGGGGGVNIFVQDCLTFVFLKIID